MPITSHQAAGMIGGQQAMFGNFASYSQQISPYNPGIAPTYANPMAGAGGGFSPPPPPTAEPQASALGPSALSGITSAAMPAAMGIGMVGSMMPGGMGRAFGMLDPSTAALQGFGRGIGWMRGAGIGANFSRLGSLGAGGLARAGLAGLGSAAAYAAPIMAIAAGAKYVGGQMVQGAQFENQVYGQLQQQFRHVNPQSRTGFGFSRDQAGSIADMLQDMGAKDMMTNAQELRRVMGGTIQMGMMKAVQDVKEFKSRFKKTVGALKEIAETMNTTLEGAMPFFNAARQSGFWTPQDIMRSAGTAKMTAQATGMSVAQVQQMTAQGAQMARSVGAMGATGARGMAASLQLVGGAVRGGAISQRMLSEATGGLTGTEAVGSLAGTLQAATTRFAASRRGRWMLAALGNQNFQQLDPAKMQQFMEGRLSIGQIGSMARRNISQQGAFNFVANERDLRGDLLKQGPQAQLGLIQGVIGKHLYGTSSKSQYITRRLMKRWFGVSGRQADLLARMAREAPDIQRENEARSASQMDAQERQREDIMNRSWEGAKRKMSQWWDENVSSPLQKLGADMSRGISQWWEKTTDRFWGRTAAHRRFRGIQGGAVRAMQRAMMGDTRSMETAFGRPGQMQRMLGVGGGGGGLGFTMGEGTPLSAKGIGWEFAGGGGFAEQFGGGGQGWGKFWGGMANIGLSSVGMGTRTNDAIETARRWGVGEYAYKTSAAREAAIAGGGMMRGAYRGVGDYNFRAMKTSDVESLRMGLLGSTGVLTRRTVAGMGMGGGVKAAREAITGAGEEMGGDIGYRAAAVRAQLGGGTGQQQLVGLVQKIRAGKVGGEKLRALVKGGTPQQAAMRLAAAQKAGKAGTQTDLSEELANLGVSDLSSEKGIIAAEDKQRWGMAWTLAGGAETDPKTGTKYEKYDDFESYKRSAAEDLESIEKKGGEKYQEALRLMAGNKQDREKGRKMMLSLAEDKDTYTDSERKRLARMGDPNDIHAKQIAKAAGKMGLVARGRNRAEFQKVMSRRMDRFRESMGKNQEAIMDIFDAVKTGRDGGKKIGEQIRQMMTGSQSPDVVRKRISDLVRSASEADKDQLQRAMRYLSGTKGGEHIVQALRGGLQAQQDVEDFTKRGRGAVRAGVMLARGVGVQLSAEQLKVLRRGGAGAEALTRKLTRNIDDTRQRRFAERTLKAMTGQTTDEKKQELLKAALARGGMQAAGQLADPTKSLLARQRRFAAKAGEIHGDEGTLKGVHGELARQTKILEMIRIGEKDPEKAIGAKKGGKEGKKQ